MGNVNGKSVLITGGAGDIGKAVATQFAAAGASVLLVDLDEARLVQVMDEIGYEGVSYCVADVTSETDTENYVTTAVERHGGVDVLLANAGVEGVVAPMSDYELAVFDKVMAVNVTGPFLGIKHVFPMLMNLGLRKIWNSTYPTLILNTKPKEKADPSKNAHPGCSVGTTIKRRRESLFRLGRRGEKEVSRRRSAL